MSIEQAFCNGLGDLDLSKAWPTATSRLWYIKRIRSLIVHQIHRTHTMCLKIQTAYYSRVSDNRTVKHPLYWTKKNLGNLSINLNAQHVNGLTHFNLDVPNGQLTKLHVLSLGTLKYPVMLFSQNKKEQEGTQKLVWQAPSKATLTSIFDSSIRANNMDVFSVVVRPVCLMPRACLRNWRIAAFIGCGFAQQGNTTTAAATLDVWSNFMHLEKKKKWKALKRPTRRVV